jgi:hypothetical protein
MSEESDNEDEDDEEDLSFLLGGLSSNDIDASAWENESDHRDGSDESEVQQPSVGKQTILPTPSTTTATSLLSPAVTLVVDHCRRLPRQHATPSVDDAPDAETQNIFTHAYKCSGYCSPQHRIERPPVRVAPFPAGKGNGLVAARRIVRGEVIYTERAAASCQVPGAAVRACQFCFRSLEPARAACATTAAAAASDERLPRDELWPVLDVEWKDADETIDKYGRMRCGRCDSWFCSTHCRDCLQKEYGSCCTLKRIVKELPSLLRQHDDGDDEFVAFVHPSIALVMRMWIFDLLHYRKEGTPSTLWNDLCGEAVDVTSLELGIRETSSQEGDTVSYTLQPVYDHLLNVYYVTEDERAVFSLEHFLALVAKAARNGFGIYTQSPFEVYYAALLRSCGGRGTSLHRDLCRQVALALGSEEGVLDRGMQTAVQERVAAEIVALFQLTARVNHSCSPNAVVQSQQFMDHHIDVVATKDIETGEEITISYIAGVEDAGGGRLRKRRARRQRELQAKYLFTCNCPICKNE